jgi:GTP cyclohydrolase I
MSRFVEVLHEWADRPVASPDIEALLSDVRVRSGSITAETRISFRYFISKRGPVSGREGFVDYGARFVGRLDESGFQFRLGVEVPISTVCPCSKAISDHGAHNQRAIVDLAIEPAPGEFIWLEEMITLVEEEGSCPVFSVLKREDEKWVTEHGYEKAKFVEDVVRDIVLSISNRRDVAGFGVSCESLESIHNHSAEASVGWVVCDVLTTAASNIVSAVAGS